MKYTGQGRYGLTFFNEQRKKKKEVAERVYEGERSFHPMLDGFIQDQIWNRKKPSWRVFEEGGRERMRSDKLFTHPYPSSAVKIENWFFTLSAGPLVTGKSYNNLVGNACKMINAYNKMLLENLASFFWIRSAIARV